MIIVKNRQLMFSNREDYLGTPYDRDSTNRVFRLDRINEDGTDLAKLDFNLDMQYMTDLSTDSALLEKSVDNRYVYLTWLISDITASKVGAIKINLRGKDASGLIKWSSYQNVVYIETTGSPITPPEGTFTELEQYEAQLEQWNTNLSLSEEQRVSNESERIENEKERQAAEELRQQQFDQSMNEFDEDREELQGYVEDAAGSASSAADSAGAAADSASDAEEAKNAAEIAKNQAEGAAVSKIDDTTIKRNTSGEMYVNLDNETIGKDEETGAVKLLAEADAIGAVDKYGLTDETPTPAGTSTKKTFIQNILDKIGNMLVNTVVTNPNFQSKLMEFLVNNAATNVQGFGLDARMGKTFQDQIDQLNSGQIKNRVVSIEITAQSESATGTLISGALKVISVAFCYNNDFYYATMVDGLFLYCTVTGDNEVTLLHRGTFKENRNIALIVSYI